MEPKRQCKSPGDESLYMRVVGQFIRIMRRHHANVERRIADLNVHQSQHRLLLLLSQRNETPSQRELAEELGVSPAAVTTTLQRLEREGYISRNTTHEDNRRNAIRITEAGLAKVEESWDIFERADRALFDGFSREEISVIQAFFERIDKNLDAAGAPADPLTAPKRAPKIPD